MARRTTTITRLRRLLLAVLVLAVAAVAGLYLFGRAGKKPAERRADDQATAAEGMTLVGEDFDYTFSEKERPIFRIKGDSVRADRAGTLFLDGVAMTFYDPEGNVYHVESRQASFNRTSNEGRLQGNVVVRGPGDLELKTPQLQIRENGHVMFSPRPVEMRYAGQYLVQGNRLRVELPDEVFILQGQARVSSLPGAEQPVAARAQRAIYERHRKLLRIEGDAHLARGTQKIQAQRISAFLSADEKSLVFVRALWDVKGESTGPKAADGGSTLVRFSGKDLAVMLAATGNEVRKVELEGAAAERATLQTVGGGLDRTLTALRLAGVMNEGVLSRADAFGGVDIHEVVRGQRTADGKPVVRDAHGRRAQALFRPDGHLASFDLNNEVTFRDPQVRAAGNRASVDLETSRGEFFGSPVTAESEKGRMTAPRVVYDTEHQIMHAQGGVRALLEKVSDAALAGSALAEGEGPVQVESREAFWSQEPSSFVFRGDVRAWRGESLMLSQEMRGEKVADRLTATGGVKTLWKPTEQQAAGNPKAGGAGGAAGGPKGDPQKAQVPRSPIEVVASEMVYQQGARLLTYTGAVQVEQESKTLSCQKLDVLMNEQKKPQKMTCAGQAKLVDPKAGRTIEGGTAVYLLDQRQVEFTGDKVTMKDKDGNQVQGRRVLYSIDDGKVQVLGKDPAQPTPAAGAKPG